MPARLVFLLMCMSSTVYVYVCLSYFLGEASWYNHYVFIWCVCLWVLNKYVNDTQAAVCYCCEQVKWFSSILCASYIFLMKARNVSKSWISLPLRGSLQNSWRVHSCKFTNVYYRSASERGDISVTPDVVAVSEVVRVLFHLKSQTFKGVMNHFSSNECSWHEAMLLAHIIVLAAHFDYKTDVVQWGISVHKNYATWGQHVHVAR